MKKNRKYLSIGHRKTFEFARFNEMTNVKVLEVNLLLKCGRIIGALGVLQWWWWLPVHLPAWEFS